MTACGDQTGAQPFPISSREDLTEEKDSDILERPGGLQDNTGTEARAKEPEPYRDIGRRRAGPMKTLK